MKFTPWATLDDATKECSQQEKVNIDYDRHLGHDLPLSVPQLAGAKLRRFYRLLQ